MQSVWIRRTCTDCGKEFVVHKDWSNPQTICDVCILVSSDLFDAIDTVLNTNIVSSSIDEKNEIKNILKSLKSSLMPKKLNNLKYFFEKNNLPLNENDFKERLTFGPIFTFLKQLKSLNESSMGDPFRIAHRIVNILDDDSGSLEIFRKTLLAQMIVENKKIHSVIKVAIKENRRLSKLEKKFKKINDRRSGLVTDGRRRMS